MTSYFAVGAPIWTKFRRLMHNNMQITANWSRSKPEVEFQYLETENSYISAANGDISMKFGLLIDFDFLKAVTSRQNLVCCLLKAVTSTNTKPEVVFSGRGGHLEKQI